MVAAPACHGHSRGAGSANKRLLRVMLLVVAHAVPRGAQACGFESFSRLKSIMATCCESASTKDCSTGFPKSCPLACGKMLIPVRRWMSRPVSPPSPSSVHPSRHISPDCGLMPCFLPRAQFYNDCRHMMAAMPAQNFKFKVKDMEAFVKGCEHTQELFHYSTGTCAASAKAREQRALDVSASLTQ
jgi:hypothetical protein